MPPFPRAAALALLLVMAACSSGAPLSSPAGSGGGPSAGLAGGPPSGLAGGQPSGLAGGKSPDRSPGALAACRQRAEEAFERRDRGSAIDIGRNPVDSPYSGVPQSSGIQGIATRSSYNQYVQDCLRSRGSAQIPATSRPAPAIRPATPTAKP